jgi:hypothetical protein
MLRARKFIPRVSTGGVDRSQLRGARSYLQEVQGIQYKALAYRWVPYHSRMAAVVCIPKRKVLCQQASNLPTHPLSVIPYIGGFPASRRPRGGNAPCLHIRQNCTNVNLICTNSSKEVPSPPLATSLLLTTTRSTARRAALY